MKDAHNPSEEEIFAEALRLPTPEGRAAYLKQACGNDEPLRRRVEALLHDHDNAGRFLDNPPAAVTASTLAITTGMVPLTEKPGDRIGRYKLLEQIGEGGCGVVYVAEQEQPVRRRVALKVIKLGMDTRQVIARFEAERQALALMDHPNIAKVLDGGATETGRPFFVMELVKGVRITDYCDRNNLSTAERLDLFMQVCHAIQHAHQKGIIHRDIKPSNILVTLHDGVPVPKVIDFGIAKATGGQLLTDKTLYTAVEQFIGTPAYMSPEQAELSGLDIDTRSDIYALGVLLYELLTGKTPFDAQRLVAAGLDEIRRIIREEDPPRPSTRISTLDAGEQTVIAKRRHAELPKLLGLIRGDLDWIVMKTLEKDRSRRYDTATVLAMDIRRHLNHEPVVARPPSNLYRFQKMVRRHKLVFTAAAAVATVLVTGVVVSMSLTIRATHAERVQTYLRKEAEEARKGEAAQRRQAESAELASRQHLYASDLIVTARAIEEGHFGLARRLLTAHRPRPGQIDLRGFEWRYLWSQSLGQQERTLSGHSDRVSCLAYSPDGTMLASGSYDHSVKIWNPRTGALITTCAGHTGEVISVGFSPDGRFMASGGNDGLVRLWDVSKWTIVSTLTNRQPRLAFSGRVLGIATGGDVYGDGVGTVMLWDYAAGLKVRNLPDAGTRLAFSPDGKKLATANANGMVKIWDRATELVIRSFRSNQVRAMAFSPDSRFLAWCAGWNGELRVWNLEEEVPALLPNGVKNNIMDLAFSNDGRTLATADQDHLLSLWNIADPKKRAYLRGHGNQIWAVAYSPEGKSLATGGRDDTVMIWNSATSGSVSGIADVIIGEWDWVGHPVFSRDGTILAAACCSGHLQVWDLATCRVDVRLQTTDLPVAFSPDNHTLLTRSLLFDSLQRWDLTTKTPQAVTTIRPAMSSYYAVAVSLDGRIIATAHPGEVTLRSAQTGEPFFALPNSSMSRSLAFSADSGMLGAGGFDRSARIWNLATRELVATVTGFKDPVAALAFSPDRTLFAAGSFAGVMKVSVLGASETTLVGHKAGVKRLAFSSDGKTLASSGDDCTVRLWNMATLREVTTFRTDVSCSFLDFSPDGRTLAAGGKEGIVHLWRAPSFAQIDAQEEAAVRNRESEGQ